MWLGPQQQPDEKQRQQRFQLAQINFLPRIDRSIYGYKDKQARSCRHQGGHKEDGEKDAQIVGVNFTYRLHDYEWVVWGEAKTQQVKQRNN